MSEAPQGPSMGAILSSMGGHGQGGGNPKHYPGAFLLARGWAEAGIGHEKDVGIPGMGGHGLAEILGGAMGASSGNPFKNIIANLFPKESFKAFADNTAGAFNFEGHAFAINSQARASASSGGAGHHEGGHAPASMPNHYNNSSSSNSSSSSGDTGSSSGSNHAYSAVHSAGSGLSGKMSDVHMSQLGGVRPDPSPGMGRSQGMGMAAGAA